MVKAVPASQKQEHDREMQVFVPCRYVNAAVETQMA
jgi:hypothetical protein